LSPVTVNYDKNSFRRCRTAGKGAFDVVEQGNPRTVQRGDRHGNLHGQERCIVASGDVRRRYARGER
jgi:hypothetical protein